MIEIITATEEPSKKPDPVKGAPADAKPEATAAQPTPALIVFGRDKDGRPHGSWFAEPDTALATKAAGVMGMRALPLDTEASLAIAAELPKGRVFASGRAFVPFVKKGLYERLSALAGPAEVTHPQRANRPPRGPLRPRVRLPSKRLKHRRVTGRSIRGVGPASQSAASC